MSIAIRYIVNVNGHCAKSGKAFVNNKDLQAFEKKLIKEYRKNTNDEVEVLFR